MTLGAFGVSGREEERNGDEEREEEVEVRSGVESENFLRKMSRKRWAVVAIVVDGCYGGLMVVGVEGLAVMAFATINVVVVVDVLR